jgi:hypothetical protein
MIDRQFRGVNVAARIDTEPFIEIPRALVAL